MFHNFLQFVSSKPLHFLSNAEGKGAADPLIHDAPDRDLHTMLLVFRSLSACFVILISHNILHCPKFLPTAPKHLVKLFIKLGTHRGRGSGSYPSPVANIDLKPYGSKRAKSRYRFLYWFMAHLSVIQFFFSKCWLS